MIKYTHIEGFHNIVRTYQKMGDHPEILRYRLDSPVTFRGTVKLHGSNCGVVLTPDAVIPQSRNRALSIEEDNYGFAAYVARPEVTKALRRIEKDVRGTAELDEAIPLVLFGELVGAKIQKGVAVSLLPERQWVLFGCAVRAEQNGEEDVEEGDKAYIDALPSLGDTYADIGLFSITDVSTWELSVDFRNGESLETARERATAWVEEVEKVCPWGARFGIEGVGEGIVFIPIGEHWGKSWLYWKAKGEKHKKVKGPKVALAPEVVASIDAFVDLAVTAGRLEQGLEVLAELGHPVEMRSTGHFLKWLGQDVARECRDELEASGLEWKQVAKAVSGRGLAFFKKATTSIG